MRAFIFAVAVFVLPVSLCALFGVSPAVGIVITAAAAWIFEIVPVGMTALLIPVLGILSGMLPVDEAFRHFGSEVVFLLVGVSLLSQALRESGLGERIACLLLSFEFFGRSLRTVTYTLTFLCWFLGMWISNTAACSLMLPLVLSFLQTFEAALNKEDFKRISYRMILLCSITPGLSGISTPFGALPNLFTFKYLQERGVGVDFLEWAFRTLPVSIALVLGSVFALDKLYPVPQVENPRRFFQERMRALGTMTRDERVIVLAMVSLLVFWVVFPFFTDASRFSPTVGALLAVFPLFIIPSVRGGKILANLNEVPLSAILLFGGGLSLGAIVESGGLAQVATSYLREQLELSPAMMMVGLAILALLISETCSNTATMALLYPLVFAYAQSMGLERGETLHLAFGLLAAGTLGFCMPAGTLPNVIVYSSGKLPIREMVKSGVVIDTLGLFIVLAFYFAL